MITCQLLSHSPAVLGTGIKLCPSIRPYGTRKGVFGRETMRHRLARTHIERGGFWAIQTIICDVAESEVGDEGARLTPCCFS